MSGEYREQMETAMTEGIAIKTRKAESPPEDNPLRYDLQEGIQDVEEARNSIKELRDAGVNPFISIPREYVETIKKEGTIRAKETWIPRAHILAGTIGIEPYAPEADRMIFEVVNTKTRVEPRFTGKDKKFHGIVWFPDESLQLKKDLQEFHPPARSSLSREQESQAI